jgi:sirohydrochlorin cobaltochelatase
MSPARVRPVLLALAAALAAGAAPASAQRPASEVGTLIVAHGGGPEWDAKVDTIASQVRTGGPVAVSLLMGSGAPTRRFQDAVAKLASQGAREIVVVPMLVSSHSGHVEQIRYLAGATDSLDAQMMHHLHMAGIERPAARVPMRLAPALDDAPQLARVLADRAAALATAPREQALFLVGHGPNGAEENAAWMKNLRRVADTVRARTGFRDVKVGLVRDDAPAPVRAEAVRSIRETIALQHALTGEPVVVVPILISSGSVSRSKLPNDLAGLPIVYKAVPLLPHPEMARWVESRVSAPAAPAAAAARPHAGHH